MRFAAPAALAALCLLLSPALAGETVADAVAYPLTVEDDIGRTVSIASRPTRVVAVGPSTTETLFAMAAEDLLVGVDRFSNYPPEAADIERVGGLVDPSIERIVALRPDVVFMRDLSMPHVARLEALGVPVVVVASEDIEGVFSSLKLFGWVLDARARAAEVAADLRARLATVAGALEGLTPEDRPTVFYELGHDPLYTAGPGSFVHEVLTLAGGVNVAADAHTAWTSYSVERLLQRDPEIVLVTVDESLDAIREGRRAQWRSLRAVGSGRLHLIDGDAMNRPGPGLADAVESVARLLHPDRFPEDDASERE